jgi:hypothetical protein
MIFQGLKTMNHQQQELSWWQYDSENTMHWKCRDPSKLWWRVRSHWHYLTNAVYVPGLNTNIAGARKLKQAGYSWDFEQ